MSERYRSRTKRTLLVVAMLLLCGALAAQTSIVGGRRLTPVAAAQASDGILAVVGANGASLYDRPGGDVVLELGIGATLTAVGRSSDSRWVMVMTDSDDVGWAEADDLVLFGIAELPVMVEDTTAPDAQPTAAQGTATQPPEEATSSPTTEVAPADTPTSTPSPTPVPPTATPTYTPTNTPSPTPVPPTATFTPTPAPTATRTPARSSSRASTTVVAVAGSRGATLYDAPNGSEQYTLATGTAMTADARSDDGEWVSIRTATDDVGWVAVDDVVIFNVVNLPVVEMAVADMAADETAADVEEQVDDAAPDDATTEDAASDGDEMAADATPEPTTDDVAMADTSEEVSAEERSTVTAEEETVEPTASPTATPTVQATPRPMPEIAEGDVTATVVLTGTRLNVRSGPGVDYAIVTKAYPDEVFLVTGRNEAGDWLQIDVPDISGAGWVSAELVLTSDLIVDLPVADGTAESDGTSAGAADAPTDAEPSILPTPTPAPQSQSEEAPATVATGPTGLSGKLAITTGGEQGDIYLYDLATGSLRFITKGYEPEMSRDGSSILFTRYGGEPGVYEINVDGSGEQRVSGDGQAAASPKMSPDGNWIVFSHLSGTYKCHNLGSFVGCVSEGRFCPSVFPNCLPDDLKIELPEFGLARVNVNGDEYRDIATLTSARAPDWNEAGIVYDSATGIEISQDSPDGETENVIAERWYQDADWQPGGGRIVFHAREGSHFEIFSVNPDGSGLTALTRPLTTLVENLPSNVAPAWSPDGKHIVYLSSRDNENDRGDWRIWVMDADGGNQRPLPVDLPFEYGFAHEQMVGWGP